uniref:Sel1 repeat family protein n=1 Tax=Aureoumbra lagunensis TaxID=44058 RepID=A0A7S3NL16_9STRA
MAVEWYHRAADQGDADARCYLGHCYYFGQGVEQNYNLAVEWYHRAADQGDADAQCHLGHCYYFGQGLEQNYDTALEWYRLAADQSSKHRKTFRRMILTAAWYR